MKIGTIVVDCNEKSSHVMLIFDIALII